MDRNLFRRGSTRCFDHTAFEALRNIEKEENKMDKMDKKDKTGELWEIETASGYVREVIVVKDSGESCIILSLTETKGSNCDIDINCKGMKYSSSKRLQYCFSDKFKSFVRKMTKDEYESVMDKVRVSLGIKQTVEVIKEHVPEVIRADESHELAAVKAKLEVYEKLYTELLQKTIRGAV